MILTVTINFALDVTHHLEHFERGATGRVESFGRRAGGKGVNAARVLHALGRDVAVTGLVGGVMGSAARAELRRAGMRDELVEIGDESRLTLMVAEEDGQATGFSEPGPQVTVREWEAFHSRFDQLLRGADGVVLSGSLPRGTPIDVYARLVSAARAAGVPVLLDADGPALMRGVAAGPDIVKVNAAELHGATGERDLPAGAALLRRTGARAAVISAGADGLTAVADGGAWHAAPPRALTGNPTGAGDATSASLIAGLLDGFPWPQRLADAAALSAAAVCAPLAGSFDAEVYDRLRTEITARELPPPR